MHECFTCSYTSKYISFVCRHYERSYSEISVIRFCACACSAPLACYTGSLVQRLGVEKHCSSRLNFDCPQIKFNSLLLNFNSLLLKVHSLLLNLISLRMKINSLLLNFDSFLVNFNSLFLEFDSTQMKINPLLINFNFLLLNYISLQMKSTPFYPI